MPMLKIKNDKISEINESELFEFPKYTTQIMNLANQNAGGTRPRVVGQLSELFPQYMDSTSSPNVEEWEKWYIEKYPNAIEEATQKVLLQIDNLKTALPLVTDELIQKWIVDLIKYKTFNGMYFQKAIISSIAEIENKSWRLARPIEEAKGIDGFIGEVPVSIKPDTYEYMKGLNEKIDVKIITYSKKKDGIIVYY